LKTSFKSTAQSFWNTRQRHAAPGAVTGYLLDESPPSIGRHRFEGEWRQLMAWLGRYPIRRQACLDVGCGTGLWMKALAAEFETVEGWDYAPAMVKASRGTLKAAGIKNARAFVGEVTKRRGTHVFDMIFVGGVIMYTPEAELMPLLKSLRRLLKPGGLLVLRESTIEGKTWVRSGMPLRPGLLATAKQKQLQDYVAVYRSRRDLAKKLELAGFTVKATKRNLSYTFTDLTEDWLRRLNAGPASADAWARLLHGLRWVLLYPEFLVRKRQLRNDWFLSTWMER
jgi:SAM-dependent methyltransferase